MAATAGSAPATGLRELFTPESAPGSPVARSVTAGRYPTTGELARHAGRLAVTYPGLLRLRAVGTSRAGRPLWLLSAGRGRRDVLTVAGAHANEPVGGASALHLAERLALDPAVLDALDCAWHVLLCLDPDGLALSERHGWPYGEWGVEHYYRHFYRQQFTCQPESRPVGGRAGAPLPESDALVDLLDELRPAVQFSLHGIEVGGTFLQLTRAVPGAARAFRELAGNLRIPVEDRPFDGMDWFVEGPGVLVLPGTGPAGERDASGFRSEVTWTYPMRYGTVSAVIEAPMWAVDAVADPRPTAASEEHIARVSRILLERAAQVEAVLGPGPGDPPPADLLPYDEAARELLGVGTAIVRTWTTYLAEGLGGVGLATTVGNSVSLDIAARRLPLRAAAMLRQTLGDPPADPVAAGALDDMVRRWSRELETVFGARWLPVRRQTTLHVHAMLRLARLLLGADDGEGTRTDTARGAR
ncbi:hydroxylacyl-CoA dehydrogenase [Streptomyces ruber]|uniref:Hydroxylacyl-CoA dehydrogenase n=2 Tax=Streptomyces TaxID=1883 RepID=A0A918EQG6_9ACTN|nr:M14 family zinc carboxypeptidase [Streptomyces ruber]GGQ55551.1 hydroxylacyl-CoA dehydrogenase [Streptomyces ruber]